MTAATAVARPDLVKTDRPIELSIVMPCLDEARTVQLCVRKALAFLARTGIEGEIIVADNGSVDGSQRLATEAGARVVQVSERGYGAALQAGIGAARGVYVVMGDSDDSYDFARLDAFIEALRAGQDLVLGNRFAGGIAQGAMPPLHRYLGNPVLSGIGRLFFGSPVRDFHCGLRAFRRQAIADLDLRMTGMEFASEMVVKATLRGLSICEVPTTLQPDGRDRPPHLRSWRDGWRHLRFLLLLCPRWLFLYPGLVLLATGTAGLLALQPQGWHFEGFGLGVHSLLYMAAAIVLGMQLLQFAVLTHWLTTVSGLRPRTGWLDRMERWWTLEKGLVLGAGLFIAGLGWSIALVGDWGRAGFGPLDPQEAMRSVIPAVTLMIVGAQAGVGSLFAAVITLCLPGANSGHRHE